MVLLLTGRHVASDPDLCTCGGPRDGRTLIDVPLVPLTGDRSPEGDDGIIRVV